MSHERRTSKRFRVNLPARWQGLLAEDAGSISDISPSGCFLLTRGDVKAGEVVRLWINFPNSQTISQWGEVVYPVNEMGFGLRFVFSSADEIHALERIVESLS
jgi:PilZ domain